MKFLPEWLPNVHPLVIHFPIVLIFVAVAINLVQVLRPNGYPVWIFYLVATLSAIFALLTGENGSELLTIPDHVFSVLNSHSDWAHRTVYAIGITTGIAIIGHFKLLKYLKIVNISTLFLGLMSIFLIAKTADHGGQLVYKYNLGTQNAIIEEQFIKIDSTDLSDEIWLVMSSDNSPIILSIDSLHYQSISMSINLNLNGFKGFVDIVHHFQDELNFDFMRINSDKTMLGRMEDGKENILNSKLIKFTDWTIWKCYADGRHFRGYLNEKMMTHGHIDPFPSGKTFIQVNGQGEIGIKDYLNKKVK